MSDADRAAADRRVPLAPTGLPDRPEAHLEPVVAAEVAWGNRVLAPWSRTDPLLDDRALSFLYPMHVELLRAKFRFPASVTLHAILPRPGYRREKARLLLTDTDRYVTIHSPLPEDWPYGEGEVAL
ncbi:hypothetical protein [Actinacidiphila alni]|uniref:hypothetical protein n=1 Tax=Actinacidiphila alni TaxID=380248 RepID=UPI0034519988